MKNLLTLLLLLFSLATFAQSIPKNPNLTDKNGFRQGKWTIWFNKDWKPTQNKDSLAYYSLIEYKDDKPVGTVTDYYLNGKKQFEGQMLADRPKEVKEGKAVWYHENGNKSQEVVFKNGQVVGQVIEYNLDGSLKTESWKELNKQGTALYQQGKLVEALLIFEKAKTQAEKEFGKEHPNYANSLNSLADLYKSQGNYDKAEPPYLEALKIIEKALGKEHPDYANSLNNLALLYKSQGNYAKAEPLLVEALKIIEKALGKEHADYASSLNNLANLYKSQGNYAKAEPLYLEDLRITEKALGKQHPDYAISLNNLAALYKSQGNYAKAEPLYLEALKIKEKVLGKEHPSYAISLNNLAALYDIQGNYTKAEPLYLEDLRITEKALGKQHPDYATSLMGLADLYKSQGNFAKAEPLLVEAKEVYANALGKEHFYYAISLNNLALLHKSQGNYTKAAPLYVEALKIIEKALGKENPDYARALSNLAELCKSQGNYDKAEPLYLESLKIVHKHIERNFPTLSEQEKEAFYKTFQSHFEHFNSFCQLRYAQNPAIAGEMYNNQLATKALLLNSSSKWKQRIRSSGDKKLFALYSDWEDKKATLNKLYKKTDPAQRKTADSLENLTNALEKELSRRSELFASFADRKHYTWQEVQAKLKPNEATLEIIRFRKYGLEKIVTDSSDARLPRYPQYDLTDTVYYAALLLTPLSKSPQLILLENGNDLEKNYITLYHNLINLKVLPKDKKRSPSRASDGRDENQTRYLGEVYRQFWGKIGSKLKQADIRKVYFSPDGVYNSLNLNTLYNAQTGNYLVDELQLILVTNSKDLLAVAKDESYNNLAYLFGYPDYEFEQRRPQQTGGQGQNRTAPPL